MSLLETVQLEHLPSSHTLHFALFRDVKNAAFLHQQLLAGNTDFEYALIDATIIVSKIHAQAAAYRATNDLLEDRLRSRNVHSEIVFSLSPNNNISSSFRTFGLTPQTTSLLVIKLTSPTTTTSPSTSASTPLEIQSFLAENIDGTQIPFEDDEIARLTDWTRVRKGYRLNGVGAGGKGKGHRHGHGHGHGQVHGHGHGQVHGVVGEEERKELEVLILGAMAVRGSTN